MDSRRLLSGVRRQRYKRNLAKSFDVWGYDIKDKFYLVKAQVDEEMICFVYGRSKSSSAYVWSVAGRLAPLRCQDAASHPALSVKGC